MKKLAGVHCLVVAVLVIVTASSCSRGESAATAEGEDSPPTDVAVHVTEVATGTIRGSVVAYGVVVPAPASQSAPPATAKVASPVAGLVEAILCAEGQRVRRGSTLFRLDSRLADITVAKAKQALEFAEVAHARQQALLQADGASARAVQEASQQVSLARQDLATAEAQRALLTVTAPIDGTVVRVGAQPGASVEPTSVLAEIVDLDRLVVELQLPSTQAALVVRGASVQVVPGRAEPRADERGAVATTVNFIGPQVDTSNDSVVVRAPAPHGSGLRPGQAVTARIVTVEHQDRLLLPVSAVATGDGGDAFVALVEGDMATRVPVTVGLRDSNVVEVSSPRLHRGVVVVAEGAQALPERTKVHVVAR